MNKKEIWNWVKSVISVLLVLFILFAIFIILALISKTLYWIVISLIWVFFIITFMKQFYRAYSHKLTWTLRIDDLVAYLVNKADKETSNEKKVTLCNLAMLLMKYQSENNLTQIDIPYSHKKKEGK